MIAVASNSQRVRRIERVIFWLLRLATYFILACATYIFLDIGIKGSRTVFISTPPFINIPFLTEPPQYKEALALLTTLGTARACIALYQQWGRCHRSRAVSRAFKPGHNYEVPAH